MRPAKAQERMRGFSEELLNWYQNNRRILPWREDPTPYHVWLSEIMLQQTRVEAVKGYYSRFLETLPDVASLAEASEDTCLKLWEGLGYYSRVRNLQKAAREVMDRCGGKIPETASGLKRLPGIGQYTSAAIASIAFGERIPAVDGNLLRIYARLALYEDSIRTPAAQKKASEYFADRMPAAEAAKGKDNLCGSFNQALMDLGNAVCVPGGTPDCEHCPLAGFCRIHSERPGREGELPFIPAAKEKKTERLTVFLIRNGEKTAVKKRPSRGLLAGLYEFPNAAGELSDSEAVAWLRENNVEPVRIRRICDAEHIFTHKRWIMHGYEVITDSFEERPIPFIMADLTEITHKYCIPSAFGSYLNWLKTAIDKYSYIAE